MKIAKYSMGIGDRFAHQGRAQLQAFIKAREAGVEIAPVWNKSFREHAIIQTDHTSVRNEADAAIKALDWQGPYYVDADHIGLKTVDSFIEVSDFFTLDVADYIGQKPMDLELDAFVDRNSKYIGKLEIPGIDEPISVSKNDIETAGTKFLFAVKEAGKIYKHIEENKGKEYFITEVSMDESEDPQTPAELFFILAAIAQEGIPAQTIAPKFTGRFNKGVDYVGDLEQFSREFEQDLAVIRFAISEFGLPETLKLSVHSGSDKFSIYEPIKRAIKKFDAGLHIKTAGTTWLEELIGLALAGGDGLILAKEIYGRALERYDELAKPYAAVIDIDPDELPSTDTVQSWDGNIFAQALRHDQTCELYNPNFRQLLHVGYKVAAEMRERFSNALEKHQNIIAKNVTENIYDRHIKRLFL
ncbi:hypothetical protein GF406_25295 [candidate division KSB1 bacterium]|nr:hypothetical protein [candidate division KSB1 bacterium]